MNNKLEPRSLDLAAFGPLTPDTAGGHQTTIYDFLEVAQ